MEELKIGDPKTARILFNEANELTAIFTASNKTLGNKKK
jgi:hypothetical protein